MQGNRTAIQLISLIMSKQSLNVTHTLDLVQILNTSESSCRDVITILEDIFKHQKSGKILVSVHALEYFVKNCNLSFHHAANRQSFQKRLLSLLNRIRGKTNLIKQLNSNTDNWCRIQAKVLYVIQLWYDTFILQENKYPHIINSYKVLRKENITFPPRSVNEKNLVLVETESPIFDNIQQIAYQDQKKFNKKLTAMGMGHLKNKMDNNIKKVEAVSKAQTKVHMTKEVNIDDISQKIAIIQSTQNCTSETLKVIEQIKKSIQYGKVKPNEEAYWKQIKSAAEKLVEEWESKNAVLVQSSQQRYLQKKLGMIGMSNGSSKSQKREVEQKIQQIPQIQAFDLLDVAFDEIEGKESQNASQNGPNQEPYKGQMNLLDF